MKSSLSKAEKRVAIAKDVIAQLKAKKFVAETGTYVSLEMYPDGKKELQTELENVGQCTVCALGALFLSDVRKNDRCTGEFVNLDTYSKNIDSYNMRERLHDLFKPKQMALIEAAFELGYEGEGLLEDDDANQAAAFGFRYDNKETRLIAIMRNIIRNKGEFKLPKELLK